MNVDGNGGGNCQPTGNGGGDVHVDGHGKGDRGGLRAPGAAAAPGATDAHVLAPMRADDLPQVLELWRGSEGLGLGRSDEPEALARFLERNPGLSFVARSGGPSGTIIGAVLGGYDGRRGYLHHLAVAGEHRRQGIGRALVERCCAALARLGLEKCHVFVYPENETARRFWTGLGYIERTDLRMMSRALP